MLAIALSIIILSSVTTSFVEVFSSVDNELKNHVQPSKSDPTTNVPSDLYGPEPSEILSSDVAFSDPVLLVNGTGHNYGFEIDSANNHTCVVGRFQENLSVDNTQIVTIVGQWDGYIMCSDESGNRWGKSIGGEENDEYVQVSIIDNSVYALGNIIEPNTGYHRTILTEYDLSNGSEKSSLSISSTVSIKSSDFIVDDDLFIASSITANHDSSNSIEVYFTFSGAEINTVNHSFTVNSSQGMNMLLTSMSLSDFESGNNESINAVSVGGNSSHVLNPNTVAKLTDNIWVIGGSFSGSVNPINGTNYSTSDAETAAFIAVYNSNSSKVSHFATLSSTSDVIIRSLVIDNQQNMYVLGDFRESLTPSDPTYTDTIHSKGFSDIFVGKFTLSEENGTDIRCLKLINFGGIFNDVGLDIDYDELRGKIIIAGTIHNNATFASDDPNKDSINVIGKGDIDGFIASVNPVSLEAIWATTVGGKNRDSIMGISHDVTGLIHMTGYVSGNGYAGETMSYQANAEFRQIFVAKINPYLKSPIPGEIINGDDIISYSGIEPSQMSTINYDEYTSATLFDYTSSDLSSSSGILIGDNSISPYVNWTDELQISYVLLINDNFGEVKSIVEFYAKSDNFIPSSTCLDDFVKLRDGFAVACNSIDNKSLFIRTIGTEFNSTSNVSKTAIVTFNINSLTVASIAIESLSNILAISNQVTDSSEDNQISIVGSYNSSLNNSQGHEFGYLELNQTDISNTSLTGDNHYENVIFDYLTESSLMNIVSLQPLESNDIVLLTHTMTMDSVQTRILDSWYIGLPSDKKFEPFLQINNSESMDCEVKKVEQKFNHLSNRIVLGIEFNGSCILDNKGLQQSFSSPTGKNSLVFVQFEYANENEVISLTQVSFHEITSNFDFAYNWDYTILDEGALVISGNVVSDNLGNIDLIAGSFLIDTQSNNAGFTVITAGDDDYAYADFNDGFNGALTSNSHHVLQWLHNNDSIDLTKRMYSFYGNGSSSIFNNLAHGSDGRILKVRYDTDAEFTTVANGVVPSMWSLSNNDHLLSGLIFDNLTGTITGKTLDQVGSCSYHLIKASVSGLTSLSSSYSHPIQICVVPSDVTNFTYGSNVELFYGGNGDSITPSYQGGPVITYSINVSSNYDTDSISIDPMTGNISIKDNATMFGSVQTLIIDADAGFDAVGSSTTVTITTNSTPEFSYHNGESHIESSNVWDVSTLSYNSMAVHVDENGAIVEEFTLIGSPIGVTINSESGLLEWDRPDYGIDNISPFIVNASNKLGYKHVEISVNLSGPDMDFHYPNGGEYTMILGQEISVGILSPIFTQGSATSFDISVNITNDSQYSGLIFDSVNGSLYGTPTKVFSSSMIITANHVYHNAGSNFSISDTYMIKITVNPPSPAFENQKLDVRFVMNELIEFNQPNNGGISSDWSISPSLMDGLEFDDDTGRITGVVNEEHNETYLITATNIDGIASYHLKIEIFAPSPGELHYPTNRLHLTTGVTMQPISPIEIGIVDTWSCGPQIPDGLDFNLDNGIISGTPTTQGEYHLLVTAQTGGGGVITQIVIDVKDPLPPERIVELDLQVVDSSSAISYTNSNQKIFLGDSLISSVPTSSNGVLSNFSISPSASTIPGLVFDSNTGQVSGTPSQINSGVEFIISADWTFEVNGESHTVKSTTGYFIQVNVAAPHFSIPILSVEYDVGEEIMFYTPSNGGQVSSWTITGELPDGLEFDTQKGTITGKAKESSSSTYLIKAYNDDGSAEYSLELIIVGDSNDSFGSMVSDVGWSGFFAFALFFILGVASADFIKSRFQDNDEIHEEKKSHDLDKIHSENQEEISNSDSDDVTDDSEE